MSSRLVHTALVLAVVGACGAARSKPAATPHAWREVSSEHFVVWTNASAERARELVKVMENLRQVVLGVSFFKTELRGKSFVIAFNDLDEVRQYVPPQYIAQAWSASNVLLQPVIVLAASSLENDRRIVTHELTHVIAFNVIRSQPDWFSEGIAGYFETVRLDGGRAAVDVGVPLAGRVAHLQNGGLMPISDVFACAKPDCKDDRFYATTWALVTYLLTEHSALLMHYMQRLRETPAEEQAQLWSQVFPALPPDKLDHELATWAHYGRIRVMKYNVTLRDWPVSERPITNADVLAAKGTVRYLYARDAGPPAEIKQSLGLDSTHVIANLIHAVASRAITAEQARSITAAHPDDWRSWWLAWRAAETAAESREAREKTCALLEATPTAIPIEQCARDTTGELAEDPRRVVFRAATPQISACIAKGSKPEEIAQTMTVEIDIDNAGKVTAARVTVGTAATNQCVEQVLKGLTFPKDRAGTFTMKSSRPTPGAKRHP